MVRDLLTPDEVKNLHHKTIIFPSVGYLILLGILQFIRNYLCYQKGTINRKRRPLVDLKHIYLKLSEKKNDLNKKRDTSFVNAEFKQFEELEKSELWLATDVINNCAKEKFISFMHEKDEFKKYQIERLMSAIFLVKIL